MQRKHESESVCEFLISKAEFNRKVSMFYPFQFPESWHIFIAGRPGVVYGHSVVLCQSVRDCGPGSAADSLLVTGDMEI